MLYVILLYIIIRKRIKRLNITLYAVDEKYGYGDKLYVYSYIYIQGLSNCTGDNLFYGAKFYFRRV